MKKIKHHLALIFLFYLLSFAKCRKEGQEQALPPETTFGAMTFGCKVNGNIFVPRDGRGKIGLYVQYVYLDDINGKGWFLNIPAVDYKARILTSVHIVTDSLFVLQDSTYKLKIGKGFPSADYSIFPNGSLNMYTMQDHDNGELFIIKHDLAKRILAGRFWFDATNDQGDKIKITEGRFDIVY